MNNIAWKKLFEKYKIADKIIQDGHFIINSNVINDFRQARLMTKFDYRSQLPDIFKKK